MFFLVDVRAFPTIDPEMRHETDMINMYIYNNKKKNNRNIDNNHSSNKT